MKEAFDFFEEKLTKHREIKEFYHARMLRSGKQLVLPGRYKLSSNRLLDRRYIKGMKVLAESREANKAEKKSRKAKEQPE